MDDGTEPAAPTQGMSGHSSLHLVMNPGPCDRSPRLRLQPMPEADDPPLSYSLGYITEGTPPNHRDLAAPISISAEEYDEITRAVAAVARCEPPFQYLVVERNYTTMTNAFAFVEATIALGRKHSNKHPRELAFAANSAVVNWLTAIRLFLDHAETDLKRRFGADSDEHKRFQETTATQYDLPGKPGYRFVYRFRNYVQHCGMPISVINGNVVREDPEGGPKTVVQLLISRAEILDGFGRWGSVAIEIQSMDESFSLLPLAEQAMDGIREIFHQLMLIELEAAVSLCGCLRSALDRIEGLDGFSGVPLVLRFEERTSDTLKYSDVALPADAIRKMGEVADGTRPITSLYKRPSFDSPRLPTTDDGVFSENHRGVQVLSTWIAEGGTTTEYFKSVNERIADDGDVSLTIGGLVDTSVVLLCMLAIAIGGTPEGLLASMMGGPAARSTAPADDADP
jgi:hypothetical protein